MSEDGSFQVHAWADPHGQGPAMSALCRPNAGVNSVASDGFAGGGGRVRIDGAYPWTVIQASNRGASNLVR
jgi:hypothetical protein